MSSIRVVVFVIGLTVFGVGFWKANAQSRRRMTIWASLLLIVALATFRYHPRKCMMALRVDSGDLVGDPVAFQFLIDERPIGTKIEHLGAKPWVYEMKFDGSDIAPGRHTLSGIAWRSDGAAFLVHKESIDVRKQFRCLIQ